MKEAEDGEDIQLTLDPVIQAEDRRGAATRSAKRTRRRGRRRSSSTRAPRRSWRWRTGRRSTPATSPSVSNEDLINRATGFNYEPGSTFKAFTVSAALEEKLVTPATDLHPAAADPGRRPDDRRRRGARHRDPDRRPQILAHSSNVGAVDDRPRGRGDEIQQMDRPLRLRPARPGSSSRARSRASSRRSTNTRARRWATCRSARASR